MERNCCPIRCPIHLEIKGGFVLKGGLSVSGNTHLDGILAANGHTEFNEDVP